RRPVVAFPLSLGRRGGPEPVQVDHLRTLAALDGDLDDLLHLVDPGDDAGQFGAVLLPDDRHVHADLRRLGLATPVGRPVGPVPPPAARRAPGVRGARVRAPRAGPRAGPVGGPPLLAVPPGASPGGPAAAVIPAVAFRPAVPIAGHAPAVVRVPPVLLACSG